MDAVKTVRGRCATKATPHQQPAAHIPSKPNATWRLTGRHRTSGDI